MDKKVLGVLVLALVNLVAVAAHALDRYSDALPEARREHRAVHAGAGGDCHLPERSCSSGEPGLPHAVTTTFPRLCPASTWRCASTISSNR